MQSPKGGWALAARVGTSGFRELSILQAPQTLFPDRSLGFAVSGDCRGGGESIGVVIAASCRMFSRQFTSHTCKPDDAPRPDTGVLI